MRLVHYAVVNKETRKAVYVHCDSAKARAFWEAMENKENFFLGYKWLSI